MGEQASRRRDKSQIVLEEREEFQIAMAKVGFVVGTQSAYLRAFDKFAKRLDRKTPAAATLKEARRYLTELKRSGESATVYSHAAAAVRFFFEEVRGMEWKPISTLQDFFHTDRKVHIRITACMKERRVS